MSAREECPHCGRKIVSSAGNPNAPYLFVGDVPSRDDIVSGYAFSGDVGKILRSEMQRLGIPDNKIRVTTLWLHGELKKNDPNFAACFHDSEERLYQEMKHRRGIVLFGADLSQWAGRFQVSKHSGLEVTELVREDLPISGWVMVCISPGIALRQPVGDFRFALQMFKEKMNE